MYPNTIREASFRTDDRPDSSSSLYYKGRGLKKKFNSYLSHHKISFLFSLSCGEVTAVFLGGDDKVSSSLHDRALTSIYGWRGELYFQTMICGSDPESMQCCPEQNQTCFHCGAT